VQALCAGTNNGIISISAAGGTSPYEYSINNGTSFVPTSTFSSLAPGNYNVVVKDNNGCTQSKAVIITENNLSPTVSFLVATRQNERDTLVIKETCFPTPDEVRWTFHPDAIVLTPVNSRDPQIKFNTTGVYWAEMTGKFGDCYYTIRKDININPYDPNAGPSTVLPASVIKSIKVAPNPNNGVFNLIIELNRRQLVQVKILNAVGGSIAYSKNYDRTLLINDNINIPSIAASGTYVVRVTTENDSRDLMIVVNK
jgi:large repetitive protein